MKDITGTTIVEVRQMTDAEMEAEGWESTRAGNPTVIVLDDGTRIYPSRDSEGNGPGCLFGVRGEHQFYVAAILPVDDL